MDRNEFIEKVIGGFLGGIAIIASIAEMVLGEFSVESIVAATKDIAGTAIVIILWVSFVNEHKKTKGIRGSIECAMTQLENGYAPLIREAVASESSSEAKKAKLSKTVRYEIASKSDALFSNQCNNYCPFFDIDLDAPTEIYFYIRKKFFGEKCEAPFDAAKIFEKITIYMVRQHPNIQMKLKSDTSGGKVIIHFDAPLQYKSDIDNLMSIVDDMLFVYTVLQSK